MIIPKDVQIVKSAAEAEPCRKCGRNLADLANFKFTGYSENTPTSLKEYFKCRHCGSIFAIHYDYFDSEGHINPIAFASDWNSPEFDMMAFLTAEQRQLIASHYNSCPICQERRDEEIMSDAWFADFIHSLRKRGRKN